MINPTMIIISGLPCTGKTTLGRQFSEKYKLPMISKDSIKESLFDSLGYSDRERSKKLGKATYPILYYFCEENLKAQKSFIVESNFSPEFDTQKMLKLKRDYSANILIIQCGCEGETLFNRFKERSESGKRHEGHVDHLNYEEFKGSLLSGHLDILDIGATVIKINTTNIDDIELKEVDDYLESTL
jgi:predicted kinase